MPARASAFDRASVFNIVSRLLNADAPAGIAMPTRASASNSIDTPRTSKPFCGLRPKRPVGPFASLFPNNLPSQNVCRMVNICPRRQSICWESIGNKLPKCPYGPFGSKPARASAFISKTIQLNVDGLAGIDPKDPSGPISSMSPILLQYHPNMIAAWAAIIISVGSAVQPIGRSHGRPQGFGQGGRGVTTNDKIDELLLNCKTKGKSSIK